MAGDIGISPYTLNFQNAISFGRFENEDFCWERRSSFSHNRYREDVEKYCRSGSLNEMKAYFEAYFRRRALIKQASSLSQNGTDYRSIRERSHSTCLDENPVSEREFEEPYSATEGGNAYDPQNEPESIRPRQAIGSSKPGMKLNNSALTFKSDECAEHRKEASQCCDETITTACSEHPVDASSKEMTATSRLREGKSLSKGMSSERKAVHIQGRRATSNVESKNLVGNLNKKDVKELLRLKKEKKVTKSASPATKPSHSRLKQEVPGNLKTKPLHLNSTVNRPRQALGSSKPGMKLNNSALTLKSDECAEHRQEFVGKLEKKIHTKEAERHQLQAKKKGAPGIAKSSRVLRRRSIAGSAYDPQNELESLRLHSEHDTSNCEHDVSCNTSNICSYGHLVETDSVTSEHQTSDMTFDVVDLSTSQCCGETVTTACSEHPVDVSSKEVKQSLLLFLFNCFGFSADKESRTRRTVNSLRPSASQCCGETVITACSEHPVDASSKEMAATSRLKERKSLSKGMSSERKAVHIQGRRATSNVESKNLVGNLNKKDVKELLRLKKEKKVTKAATAKRSSQSPTPGCRTSITKIEQGKYKHQTAQHKDLKSMGKVSREPKKVDVRSNMSSNGSGTKGMRKVIRGGGSIAGFGHMAVGVAS